MDRDSHTDVPGRPVRAGAEPLVTLLLGCGLVGPLLYIAVFAVDGFMRPGYSAWRNYVSQLGTGSGAWVESLNFFVFGLLMIAFAEGVRVAIRGGRGSTAAPVAIGLIGVLSILQALFPMDPALGYPPGAAVRDVPTAHAVIHGLTADVLTILLTLAAAFMAWHFHGTGLRGWTAYSICVAVLVPVAGLASLVVAEANRSDTSPLNPTGVLERLAIVAGWTWLSMLALRLIRSRRAPKMPAPEPSNRAGRQTTTVG